MNVKSQPKWNSYSVLTHKGKALSDIEKYDKSMISDSDEDDEPGNLGSLMVMIMK